jgi:hypothetical protein
MHRRTKRSPACSIPRQGRREYELLTGRMPTIEAVRCPKRTRLAAPTRTRKGGKTMAYSQSDLDKVRNAISSGVRSITFADGRRTEYHSLDQLLAAEKVIAAQLTMAAESTNGLLRRRVPYYKTGL